MNYLELTVGAVLVNNFVLSRFLGICPFLGTSKKLSQASGMGISVIFVMLVATAVTWPIQYFVLNKLGIGYLQTIVFILVIATLVQFIEIVLKKFIPSLHKSLGVYLPLITTNCAVLGVTINNITDGYNFIESMVSSLGCGLGFLLAMVLFAGVRSRIDDSVISKSFKGCDEVIFADIYSAREDDIYGINSKMLADATPGAKYLGGFEEIAEYLRSTAREGDIILIMGAGDINGLVI